MGDAMKTLVAALCLMPLWLAGPTYAASAPGGAATGDLATVSHGGGCRKDSPPGQCCHAGSRPYHCH